jgi:hypothetical protein
MGIISFRSNKTMRAIEFQATAHQHWLRLPDTIPDGIPMRVLLLLEDEVVTTEQKTRRKPSPKLAGTTIMADDLIESAITPVDWDVFK